MATPRGAFSVLTKDTLILLFSRYLPLEELMHAITWSKAFRQSLDPVFQAKLDWHFPVFTRPYTGLSTLPTAHEKFMLVYKNEYKNFSARKRKIMTLLKENNLTALKKMVLSYQDVEFVPGSVDEHISLAKRMNQDVMNYLFQRVVMPQLEYRYPQKTCQSYLADKCRWAIRLNQTAIVKEMIAAGQYAQTNTWIESPHLLAAMTGNIALLEIIMKHDNLPNVMTVNETVLCRAVRFGKLELVQYLLEKMVSPEDAAAKGLGSAIEIAAQFGDLEMIALIAQCRYFDRALYQANLNEALRLASAHGDIEVMKKIIEVGAEVKSTNERNVTALHLAAETSNKAAVELLLERGADPEAVSDGGLVPFIRAIIKENDPEVVEVLLNRIDRAFFVKYSEIHLSWFKYAVNQSKIEIAMCLLANGLTIKPPDKYFTRLLRRAIKEDRLDVVKALVKENNEDLQVVWNQTDIVNDAARYGRDEIIEHLIACGCKANYLAAALIHGHVKAAQVFIDNLGGTEALIKNIEQIIIDISQAGKANSLRFLKEQFPAFIEKLKLAWSGMLAAAKSGHADVVEFFLENGVNVNVADGDGDTALHIAAQYGHEETVRVLLKHNADETIRNKHKQTPFDEAKTYQRFNVVKYFKHEKEKVYSFNCVPSHKDSNEVKLCIELGADINELLYMKNQSVLMHVIRNAVHHPETENKTKLLPLVKWLLDNGASVDLKNSDGDTALHLACNLHIVSVIRELLKRGANIYAANNEKKTPIDMVFQVGRFGIANPAAQQVAIEALLEHANKDDPTALQTFAFTSDNSKLIYHLHKLGLIVDVPNPEEKSLLYYAVGDQEFRVHLLNNGVDVNAACAAGTPLARACELGDALAVNQLLTSGADVNLKSNGVPPVLIAARHCHVSVVTMLVNANADVTAVVDGASCLDLALIEQLHAPACAMVKLDLTKVKITAELFKTKMNSRQPNYPQLRVIEVILLREFIAKHEAPNAPKCRKKMFGLFEVGERIEDMVQAAKNRLDELLYNKVEYSPQKKH